MVQGPNPWSHTKKEDHRGLLFFVRDQGFEPWTH